MDKSTHDHIQNQISTLQHRLLLADKTINKITSVEQVIMTLKDNSVTPSIEDIFSIVQTFITDDKDAVIAGKIAGSIICCLEQYKEELKKQYNQI